LKNSIVNDCVYEIDVTMIETLFQDLGILPIQITRTQSCDGKLKRHESSAFAKEAFEH